MSAVAHKLQLTNIQRQERAIDFLIAACDGTMTEMQYNEHIEQCIDDGLPPNLLMQAVVQGKYTWQEKYLKRLRIYAT